MRHRRLLSVCNGGMHGDGEAISAVWTQWRVDGLGIDAFAMWRALVQRTRDGRIESERRR